MKFQVYLFIFGVILAVRCDGDSDKHEKMKMMEGDIMDIAPSLLRRAPGRSNRAHWLGNVIPYQFEPGYRKTLL